MIDLRRRCRTETDVGHQISRVARVQKVPRLSEEWMLLQPVKMDQKIQTKKNWVGSVWMSGAESATPLPDSSPQPDVLPSFWLIVINYSHRCRWLVIWVGIYLRIGMNRICSSRCGGSASGTGGWIPTDLEPIGSNNDGEELSAVIFGANQWFFQGKGGGGAQLVAQDPRLCQDALITCWVKVRSLFKASSSARRIVVKPFHK